MYAKTMKRADGKFDVVSRATGTVLMPALATSEDANAWRDHFNAEDKRRAS